MRSKTALVVGFSLGLAFAAACDAASSHARVVLSKPSDAGAQAGSTAGGGGRGEVDAGRIPEPDAGSGVRQMDAGSGEPLNRDAGSPAVDAGSSSMDAGTNEPLDSGAADSGKIVHAPGTLTTVSFQEGVDGYHGTKSVGISDYAGLGEPGQWNANGATFADGDNDWCTGINIPYAPSYSEIWLLRFDDLKLPVGAEVVSAALEVHAFGNDSDTNVFLSGRYVKGTWAGDTPQSCAGCSNAMVGYRYRDGSAKPWAALAASGEGTDVIAAKSFRIPESGFFPTGHSPVAFQTALDPAVVQTWLTGENHGVRIVAGVSAVHVSVVPPLRDPNERPISTRPRLTITYALPSN